MDIQSIPGWFNKRDEKTVEALSCLLPYNSKVVEVGSHYGRSTVCWAQNLKSGSVVTAIDPWDVFQRDIERQLLVEYKSSLPFPVSFCMRNRLHVFLHYTRPFSNIRAYPAFSPLEPSREEAYQDLYDIDLVFIDGEHTEKAVLADLDFWYDRLGPSGILCGHDYKDEYLEVMKAVDDFSEKRDLLLVPNLYRSSFFVLFKQESWMSYLVLRDLKRYTDTLPKIPVT